MEFWRYYRIIRRRRWLILIGMVVCVGVVAFHNFTTVQLYTGRTTVMEPEGMGQQPIPLYPEQFVQLDVQLRLSNLGSIASSQRVMQAAAMTLADLGMRFTPQEILSHTSISPVRDTNILAIEVTLPEMNEAKIAADVIAAEFKRVYGELNNAAARQSREFIEAQLETTRKALTLAQEKLRRFEEESGIVMLEQQGAAIVQRLTSSKVDMAQTQASADAAFAAYKKLEQEIAKMPETQIVSRSIARDPLWQSLSNDLSRLETEKARLTSGAPGQPGLGAKHPKVISIDRQIEDIKSKLDKDVKEEYIAGTQENRNPQLISALGDWLRYRIELAGQNARLEAIRQVHDEAIGELKALPAGEAKMALLRSELDSAQQTYRLMRSKLDEARIKEQQAKNEVALKTIDPAYVFPVQQRKVVKLILALVFSPLLGVGLALLLHYADNTIKTGPEAERLLGVPVYALVPGARAHSLARQHCPEILGVSYQMLTSNLWIISQNTGINSAVMVSAEPDVGRSVTASNLAVALTREGARVVLVDADLRKPVQHMIFGVDNKVGLTNLLSGGASFEDVLVPTKIQGLLLVPAGPIPDNPVKLLRSPEMKDFAEQIGSAVDFVIYDTPAGVTFPDAVLVSAYVGSAIIVHAAGRVPRGSEAEFKARLESVGARVLGAVLNRVRREDSSAFFHYRRSYEGITIPPLGGGKKALKNGAGRAA